jgi:hypothetical protein
MQKKRSITDAEFMEKEFENNTTEVVTQMKELMEQRAKVNLQIWNEMMFSYRIEEELSPIMETAKMEHEVLEHLPEGKDYCANVIWYGFLRERITELVLRKRIPKHVCNIIYETIFETLPNCTHKDTLECR